MKGFIKSIKAQNGFGFIIPKGWKEDLFFHFSALEWGIETFNKLEENQAVEFDVIDGKKPGTKQASNIKLSTPDEE